MFRNSDADGKQDKPIKLPGFNEWQPTALNQDGRRPFSLEPELDRETAVRIGKGAARESGAFLHGVRLPTLYAGRSRSPAARPLAPAHGKVNRSNRSLIAGPFRAHRGWPGDRVRQIVPAAVVTWTSPSSAR